MEPDKEFARRWVDAKPPSVTPNRKSNPRASRSATQRDRVSIVSAPHQHLSLGVEFSLIMGAENSLVGALPGVPGRAPELRAFPSSPTMPADEVSDGGGDGGPAGRIDDDLGPSPPRIIGHGDRTPHR